MHIIKLNATSSTNGYLKQLLFKTNTVDFTVVTADKQTEGRGQMGAYWVSDEGKNLTFSVLKKDIGLGATHQFVLNMKVSLAIYDALNDLNIPNLSIKWPNDILSADKKICGILIENILSGSKIQSSVVGIGLNVNQLEFKNLPNVASLKLIKGTNFNLDEILQILLTKLSRYLQDFNATAYTELTKAYQKQLFRIDKPSTFKNEAGETFMGFIKGVSPEGKLKVLLEDAVLKEFALKEIQLLY